MLWPVIFRVAAGLQLDHGFARGDWIIRTHIRGSSLTFEVANYSVEPPFVHVFEDAFDACWFFINIAEGAVVRIRPSQDRLTSVRE